MAHAGSRCSTSTAITATARRASSGRVTTCCSPPSTATRRATTPGTSAMRTNWAAARGWASTATSRSRPAPGTLAGSPRWTQPCARSSGSAPDALVVSLGFDASRDEPLNFLAVSAGRLRPRRRRHWAPGLAGRLHPGRRLQHRDTWRPVGGFSHRLPRMSHRPRPILRVRRDRSGAGRGAGSGIERATRLSRGRPAGQGGGRGAGAGTRRPDRHGPGPAAAARADQPRTGRPAEGGQPFRPADRALRAGGDGRAAAGGSGRLRRTGRAVAGRHAEPGRRRAARRDRRLRPRAGPDLPGVPRRRGGLGRAGGGAGTARPAMRGEPFPRHPGDDPARRPPVSRVDLPGRTWPT